VPHKQLEWVTFENGDSAKVNLAGRCARCPVFRRRSQAVKGNSKGIYASKPWSLQLDDHRADNRYLSSKTPKKVLTLDCIL
jgi:hypothetical protein